MGTPGKRVYPQGYRGFESLSVRHFFAGFLSAWTWMSAFIRRPYTASTKEKLRLLDRTVDGGAFHTYAPGPDNDTWLTLFRGCLLGTAVGDSLGLPAEGLSAVTVLRRGKGRWKQSFLGSYGMVSDDTEHTVLLCRALMRHPDDADAFLLDLAWSLKWWLWAVRLGSDGRH